MSKNPHVPTNRPPKRLKIAIPLILFSALFSALMGATVKLTSSDVTPEANVFWRNAISLLLLIPFFFRSKHRSSLKKLLTTQEWRIHFVRGLANFGAILLFFYSLQFLNLANANLLFNTVPIFVPIVVYLWKGILIDHRLWVGIGISFIGIIVVLNPGTDLFQPAMLMALCSGMLGSISLVSLRLSHYSEPTERSMFYLFVFSILLSGIGTLISFDASWKHLNMQTIPFLVLTGVFGFCYQVCITVASRYAPARQVSTLMFSSVIFSMGLDHWIWKTEVKSSMYIGFALIILGSILKILLYPKDDYQMKK